MRSQLLLPAEPVPDLAAARAAGWFGWMSDPDVDAASVMATVEAAGVRGRGGAGFPTARKWQGVRSGAGPDDRIDIVVNGAEGEPGTFKDRALLRTNPYAVVDGALLAATALGSGRVLIAIKDSFGAELEALERVISELAAAGLTGDLEFTIVRGPGHYLFGEETALLEVIEGEDPLPRHIPPYLYGLFSNAPQLGWSAGAPGPDGSERLGSHPVVVNNVETYAHVALVQRIGVAAYRERGTPESPGPAIVTITGDVRHPAVAEIDLGWPLAQVIDEIAGGPLEGRRVKAVLSGVSNPVLGADALSAPVSYEGLAAAGAGLGSAGFIVYDDTRNMTDVAYRVARFLHVESCGQCNPCKTGTGAIARALEQLVLDGGLGERAELGIERALSTVTDGARCFLPRQAQLLVPSLLAGFPDDLDQRLSGVAGDGEVPLPQLVDLVDGVAIIDQGQLRKRPDWTYSEVPVRLDG